MVLPESSIHHRQLSLTESAEIPEKDFELGGLGLISKVFEIRPDGHSVYSVHSSGVPHK